MILVLCIQINFKLVVVYVRISMLVALFLQVSDGSVAAAACLHSALSLEEVKRGKARTEEINQTSMR